MAAITNSQAIQGRSKLLRTIAYTNLSASATERIAVQVPVWARYATFVVNLTMAGTSPLFDFALEGYDSAGNGGATPDDGFLFALGGWDGITQKTAASDTYTTVDVGPGIGNDDTGSATASDHYSVASQLPEWIIAKTVMDGTTGDEDYTGTISVYFRA